MNEETKEDPTPYFIRLRSADCLVLEIPTSPGRFEPKIKTPIKPGVYREYEFRSEFMDKLYLAGQSYMGKKLDEHSSVMIRLYEEQRDIFEEWKL